MPRDPGREGLVATAEHHQPRSRARTNRALRSLARARSGTRRRARAHSSAPPPARPRAPARARALEASLVRLLHSLRAEWAVGSSCSAGWEGEEGRGRRRSAWGRGRAAPAGKGLGRGARPPRAGRPGGQSGWAPRSARVPPPPPTPFCKAISAILLLPSRDSWQERIQRLVGVFVLFYFNPLCVVPFPEPPDSGKNSPCCPLPRFLSQPHCQAFV